MISAAPLIMLLASNIATSPKNLTDSSSNLSTESQGGVMADTSCSNDNGNLSAIEPIKNVIGQTLSTSCIVCNVNKCSYKCPRCSAKYCSSKCCQVHKSSCATTLATTNVPSDDHDTTASCTDDRKESNYPDSASMLVLKPDEIEILRKSVVLKSMLQSKRLRNDIEAVDASGKHRLTNLKRLRQHKPEFDEFVTTMLREIGR